MSIQDLEKQLVKDELARADKNLAALRAYRRDLDKLLIKLDGMDDEIKEVRTGLDTRPIIQPVSS